MKIIKEYEMNKSRGKQNIDVVITWVDGNDKKWIEKKKKWANKSSDILLEASEARYRDWENLRYLFRGIDEFMPWVHKVHFVTEGHVPDWLNANNNRLNIVKHEDFIPLDYLPTFNSSVIQCNIWRIPGLSEQYINFNDDMFVIKKTKQTDFFVNGLPKDSACISPQPIQREKICNTELNNLEIINSYFSKNSIKNNIYKWINIRYGAYNFRTILFMGFSSIIGVYQAHIPYSYLKSVPEKIWEKEKELFASVCSHRFRDDGDVNEWLYRSWQLLSGNFIPRRMSFGKMVSADDIKQIRKVLWRSSNKVACFNDSDKIKDFNKAKNLLNEELNKLLPGKCKFEK